MAATFPLLSSGAVTQYPLPQNCGQGANVIRFLDGSDQRHLLQGRTFRQWQIQLTLLTDLELQQLEAFFEQQQGNYQSFVFPDPISGTNVPSCRFGGSTLQSEYAGVNSSSASFWIIETNG